MVPGTISGTPEIVPGTIYLSVPGFSPQAQRRLLPRRILPALECRQERRIARLSDGRERLDAQHLVAALVLAFAGRLARDEDLFATGHPAREFGITDSRRRGCGRQYTHAPFAAGLAEDPHLAPRL